MGWTNSSVCAHQWHSALWAFRRNVMWQTHTHCQFIHIHSKNIPARCGARCKVCILAPCNSMTASIIEMAVCFIKKSQMALPDAIEQPAKELWLPFSPSSSTCTIRTLVWLNTCWWDCLHSSQSSRKKSTHRPSRCRGSNATHTQFVTTLGTKDNPLGRICHCTDVKVKNLLYSTPCGNWSLRSMVTPFAL